MTITEFERILQRDTRLGKLDSVRIQMSIAETGRELDSLEVPANRLVECMRMHTFRALLDLELTKAKHLHMQGSGEPLLVPGICDMVRYASAHSIRVTLDTNATLLYRDRAEELVEAGLDTLRVLIDGRNLHDPDVPAKPMDIMGPILENLAGLTAVRRSMNLGVPYVKMVYRADEQNLDLLPDMVMLLGGIWVAAVQVVSTLDSKRTLPVYKDALAVAEDYGVALHVSKPEPDRLPYVSVFGTLRTYSGADGVGPV